MTDTERSYIIDALKEKITTIIEPNRSAGSAYSLRARDVTSSQGGVPVNGVCDVVDQEFANMAALTLLERTGPPHSLNTTWVYSLGVSQKEYEHQTEDATWEEAGHALGWRLTRHLVAESHQDKDAVSGIGLGCGYWAVHYGDEVDAPRVGSIVYVALQCLTGYDMQRLLDAQLRDVFLARAKARMASLLAGPGAVRLVRDGAFGDLLQMYDPYRRVEDEGRNRPHDLDKVVLLAWFCLALDRHELRCCATPLASATVTPVQLLYLQEELFRDAVRELVVAVSKEAENLLSKNMYTLSEMSRYFGDTWRQRGQVTLRWDEIVAHIPSLAD